MYRSVRLLRATAPLASPAFRAPAPLRPISLGNNLAFKRVISTTPVRFNQPITGDRDPPKNKHNVENQNYTTTAREEVSERWDGPRSGPRLASRRQRLMAVEKRSTGYRRDDLGSVRPSCRENGQGE